MMVEAIDESRLVPILECIELQIDWLSLVRLRVAADPFYGCLQLQLTFIFIPALGWTVFFVIGCYLLH